MNLTLYPPSCCEQKVRHWHLVIGGFRQTVGRPNGMVALWRKLMRHNGPQEAVVPLKWNARWRHVAELIWLVRRPYPEDTSIRIYAYSWGAGWGAMQLARELDARGLGVDFMVLSDPVYRSSWLLGRALALSSLVSIRVPANVGHVHWFRQTKNRPCGHNLVAENVHTEIFPPVVLERTHQYMDDAEEFHAECLRVAAL